MLTKMPDPGERVYQMPDAREPSPATPVACVESTRLYVRTLSVQVAPIIIAHVFA